MDWDRRTRAGPLRYPFRWGFGHTLAPGETVTIEGHITLLKKRAPMLFFAGVLQEGVRIVLDRLAPATIAVSLQGLPSSMCYNKGIAQEEVRQWIC